jgi:dTDP-4-amino-4,6-dideoxygalactose transaminase
MIPLAKPDLRQEDIENAVRVLHSGMLVQGENVSALEESLSQFAGVENCSLCSSGTAALHLALKGLGVGTGDSVIVPAFTFPASANVVELSGAKTILCDVAFDDFNITSEALEQCIITSGDDLKAVMVVHEFGCPVEIKEIAELCRKHRLLLIEDAACALGTIADGHHVGFYSDVACFSFHPRKAITCGEGGAVFTRDKDLNNRIDVLRNHGMHYADGGIDFIEAGFNYRLTDFQAALIHGQLKRFPDELKRRALLAELYFSYLIGCPHMNLPNNKIGHSWQSFMVVLDNNVDRSSIIKQMGQKGVQSNLGAQALNCLSYFSEKYNIEDTDFPVATRLFHSGLVIPLYGSMTENDIKFVSTTLKELLKS